MSKIVYGNALSVRKAAGSCVAFLYFAAGSLLTKEGQCQIYRVFQKAWLFLLGKKDVLLIGLMSSF